MTIAELTEKILKEGYRITRENLDKLTNTAFCRKTRFLRLQKQTRTRV